MRIRLVLILLFLFSVSFSFGVDISDCSTLDSVNTIYYLTADIIDSTTSHCMDVQASNVTLDCQGHIIDGNDIADQGIYLYSTSYNNFTLKNCIVRDWDTGNIYLKYGDDNTIVNVTSISSPDYGVYLYGNEGNNITYLNASNNNYGIYMYDSGYNYLSESNFISNTNAVYLYNSNTKYNNIDHINVSNNVFGIYSTSNSQYNNITNSVINSNNNYGIYEYSGDNDLFVNNSLDNRRDIYVGSFADDNTFYENNLNSLNRVEDLSASTKWNNSEEGNFWEGYQTGFQECFDSNTDGFCDDEYVVGNGVDYLPIYTGIEETSYTCNGCIDCSDKINNEMVPGESIYLTTDILNSNLSKCIEIKKENIVFDGQGHIIDGDYVADYGVFTEIFASSTIKNSIINDWDSGGMYLSSNKNYLKNLTISSSDYGIRTSNINYNTLDDIRLENNRYSGIEWSGDYNTMVNIVSFENKYGLYFISSDYNNISNVTAYENEDYGLYLYDSGYNNIFDVNLSSNEDYGLYFYEDNTKYNNVTNSVMNNNRYGLYYSGYPKYNNVMNSVINDNSVAGIYLTSTTDNLIKNNSFNNKIDISLTSLASNNLIYENNLNSLNRVEDLSASTKWNNSEGGNFWEGYQTDFQECFDSNTDGFCDDEYFLNNGTDYMAIYTGIEKTSYTCNGCIDCSDKINNEMVPGESIYLTTDILNSNLSKCIEIKKENIVFDGQGHTIDGIDTSSSYGIISSGYNKLNINNCNLSDWGFGIASASYNIVNNINASSCTYGLSFMNYNIVNNIIVKTNSYGLDVDDYNNISNITSTSNNHGLHFMYADYNNIYNITSSSNDYGVYFYNSGYNNISVGIINDSNDYNIYLYDDNTKYNNIKNLIVSDSSYGVYITSNAQYNTLSNINYLDNNYGVYLISGRYNVVKDSVFENTIGVRVGSSSYVDNQIYNNIFNNTNKNVDTIYIGNLWNTTISTNTNILGLNAYGGNFWANPSGTGYSQTCEDVDSNGICDSAYTIYGTDIDNYPLCYAVIEEVEEPSSPSDVSSSPRVSLFPSGGLVSQLVNIGMILIFFIF